MDRLTKRNADGSVGISEFRYYNYQDFQKLSSKLADYEDIGAVEEFKTLKEKNKPKKINYTKIHYGKHKWKVYKNGEVDDWAWDAGYCNGVVCEVCGNSYCVYCDPDYDELEDCEVEYYNCPTCGEKVGYKNLYCECGQKIDWTE